LSRKKLHIDKLFKEGLKDFSLFVSDRDFNAIDDKASAYKDKSDDSSIESGAFSDFELEISDNDWLATKAKLDNEKNLISSDNSVADIFKEFELEPDEQDWPITYEKYKKAKRRRVAFWWLSTGIVILLLGCAALLMNQNTNESIAQQISTQTIHSGKANNIETSDNTKTNETTKTQKQEIDRKSTSIHQQNQTHSNPSKKQETTIQSRGFKAKPLLSGNPVALNALHPEFTPDPVSPALVKGNNSSTLQNQENDKDLKTVQQTKENFTLGTPTKINPVQAPEGETPEKNPDLADSTKKGKKNKKDKEDKTDKISPLKNPQLYLAMVNQVDYTYRLLAGSNNATYNSIRNNADKGMIQYTGGVEFGVITGRNQYSAGLNYTSQTWNSNYNYTYKLFDSIPYYDTGKVLKGYFLFPKKDTTMNESRTVTLTNIQLPISYTRLWDLDKRLSLSAGVSGILSYTVKAEGDKMISHENRQLYYYSRLKHHEQSFNVAPAVNFGLRYQLSNHLMLSGSMGGSMNLRSRFKSSFGAREYAYSTGINLKIIYLLK
jgi:hypothetical protein